MNHMIERGKMEDWLYKNIRPMYETFDPKHNLLHYDEVMNYACKYIMDDEWFDEKNKPLHKIYRTLLIACAYHDVGRKDGDHKTHANLSSKYLLKDESLKKFLKEECGYGEDDVLSILMDASEAIRNHSDKSVFDENENEVSKILKDADCGNIYNKRRCAYRIAFGDNKKNQTLEEAVDSFNKRCESMKKRYRFHSLGAEEYHKHQEFPTLTVSDVKRVIKDYPQYDSPFKD